MQVDSPEKIRNLAVAGHNDTGKTIEDFGLTHESLGGLIIRDELGDLLRGIRRNPFSRLAPDETLDPDEVAWLIMRPVPGESSERPVWLQFLRSLLSGIYTIDNLDFVLRDAYMSGYSLRAFDLDRLLHYSFFTESGLTIQEHSFGTNVEGELQTILDVIARLHDVLHAEGAPRLSTAIKLGTRIDKEPDLASKLRG